MLRTGSDEHPVRTGSDEHPVRTGSDEHPVRTTETRVIRARSNLFGTNWVVRSQWWLAPARTIWSGPLVLSMYLVAAEFYDNNGL